MGGFPKGLLTDPASGLRLVERLLGFARELDLEPVWVGNAEPYRALAPELPELTDARPGAGPLAGLVSLLRAAGDAPVLALACDMPFVSRALIARLLSEQPEAVALAPRNAAGFWEPLCARYSAPHALPVCEQLLAGPDLSLQTLLRTLPTCELVMQGEEAQRELGDWDRPEDVPDTGRPRID